MDSKHRHELQENDLADFLHHFGTWWNKYGNMLLTAALVVVAAFAVVRYIHNRNLSLQDMAASDLENANSPESYVDVARRYSDPAVQALAYLRGGDLLLTRYAQPAKSPATSHPASAPSPEADLKEAKEMYQEVLDLRDVAPLLRINAMFGLAAVAENERAWDKAKTYYEQAIADAGPANPVITERAKMRLEMLSRLQMPIVFGPEKPLPPASAPAWTPHFGPDFGPSVAPLGPEAPAPQPAPQR